jgi:hypothetical protein
MRLALFPWLLSSTWTHNPGNKTVRCGVITVGLFFGLIAWGIAFEFPARFLCGVCLSC